MLAKVKHWHFEGHLPVKDPVLDTVEVVGCLLIDCNGRINHLGLPIVFDKIF
jgi:hypothetical protein